MESTGFHTLDIGQLILRLSSSVVITRLQYVWADLYNPLPGADFTEEVINENLCWQFDPRCDRW